MLSTCLFSVGYAGLWGQHSLPLVDFIRHARTLGYRQVMLVGKRPHLSILDYDDERLAPIRAALQESGVTAPVLGAYIDTAGGAAAEVPYQELQIAYVERLAQLGKSLGAKIVRVFTGYERTDGMTAALWTSTVRLLGEVCDRVQPLGMTVAIQNHHDLAVETSALLELLTDINRSNCRLGFDAWSPALRGEDIYEAARAAAHKTVITTNADYVRFDRYAYRPELVNYEQRPVPLVRAVPFGTGFIDYHAFFSGLLDGGFRGVATYEMCSPLRGGGQLDNLDRYAKAYLAWMHEHGFAASEAATTSATISSTAAAAT